MNSFLNENGVTSMLQKSIKMKHVLERGRVKIVERYQIINKIKTPFSKQIQRNTSSENSSKIFIGQFN